MEMPFECACNMGLMETEKSNCGGFDGSHCLRIDVLCHGDTEETGISHVSEPDYAVSKRPAVLYL